MPKNQGRADFLYVMAGESFAHSIDTICGFKHKKHIEIKWEN